MTDLVDRSEIERIVGRPRDQRLHFARNVEGIVYVLHSYACLKDYPDLRDCPFSLAMDNGLDPNDWEGAGNLALEVILVNKMVPAWFE